MSEEIKLRKIDDYRWEIPKGTFPGMRVPGMIFADEKLLSKIKTDQSLKQVANVAHLPGIVKYSLAMPDIHWGYGFPIGGVAATDPDESGVISPGGIGFDVNCGIRLVRTNLTEQDIRPKLRELVRQLFNHIPCGVGQSGAIRVGKEDGRKLLVQGARWAVQHGHGAPEDLAHTEAGGVLEDADPDAVSKRAYERGSDQLGTLGSGNHFVEVQAVDTIFDEEAARIFGLEKGQITVMIHSGSRGFGYQICDDFLELTRRALSKYHIEVPDVQLACAPVNSPEGRQYLGAMRCAANYAWNNRQCLMSLAREVFEKFFGRSWQDLGMDLVYDVAHNIAKFEKYRVNGKEKMLCIHRKGATRAFGPGHPELPKDYQSVGQPVIIPGDMGRNSYVLVGTAQAAEETFGTTCHGAGRAMSRSQAVREARGRSIERELEAKGIIAIARGRKGLDEEQPAAYKDVNDVVEVVHQAGLAKKVVRMQPLGVIKG
ncbi:MAG: RtcB family protein [Candidatus Omnitrophica bacterium]|nr:RtcB family protein [Candidatus Omnitrophota bacterium]